MFYICIILFPFSSLSREPSALLQFVSPIKTADGWQKAEEPPFALQIVSEEKAGLMWADNGVLYVGRRPETNEWFASCQFY